MRTPSPSPDGRDGSQDGHGTSPLRSVHHLANEPRRQGLVLFLRTIDAETGIFP